MMDKLTLICASITLAVLILLGPSTPVARKGIAPQLQPYVNEFTTYAKLYQPNFKFPNINVDVQNLNKIDPFNNPDFKVVGICNILTKNVMIDVSIFEYLPKEQIEQIVWHEFGHCVLNRIHIETLSNDGNPISMMHPYVLELYVYKTFRVYYIKELFLGFKVWKEFPLKKD